MLEPNLWSKASENEPFSLSLMSSSAFKSKPESSSLDLPFQPSGRSGMLRSHADEPCEDSRLRAELCRKSWGSDAAAYGGGGEDLTWEDTRLVRPGGRGRG